MSDPTNLPPPPGGPPAEQLLPAMPEPFVFNAQLLEQWVKIPQGERLAGNLTRQDVDYLLFGLLRGAEAQSALDNVLVSWSNGKIDEANRKLLDFRRLNTESLNNIRQFFTGLMISAIQSRKP